MKNARRKIFSKQAAILLLAGTFVVGQAFGVTNITASAQTSVDEIVYCDDTVYGTEEVFWGGGDSVVSTYSIDCDQMVEVAKVVHPSAPSYGNGDSSMQNVCGPMAGTNIVVFYDRYYPNLIPNFEPGMTFASGIYEYYPDLSPDATDNVISSLYSLMNVAQVGGTTSANFKNGLRSFVQGKGYSCSYSSMYQSATNVNLTTLANAINQGKVGMLMCSTYNFVYAIDMDVEGGEALIGKVNSPNAHMMMVYGYKTLAFYKQGAHVCTKTFLYACSGYGMAEKGYMELNSYSTINEALIVSVA